MQNFGCRQNLFKQPWFDFYVLFLTFHNTLTHIIRSASFLYMKSSHSNNVVPWGKSDWLLIDKDAQQN